MNILERGYNAFKALTVKEEQEVLANGQIVDKKDIEDPTGKFAGMRHVRTYYKTERLRRNVEFFKPEYDLPTIANAIQMDGLLQRSVNVFVEQILKNGYEFTTKNDRLQRHVNRRLKEIQNLTGIPLYETMSQVATQLVTYGNAYIIKVRSEAKSAEGRPFRLYGKNMNPVVGLFVADATTIEIGINDTGQIVNYKQLIRGEEIYWDERDVIHFTYNRIPGTLTGMSSIIPILDDVRALRKLEEEIEILGFQYSIPLYLYKVGTKDQPPAANEIEQVTSTVNNMPAYGMLVVPGHHTIEVPTNNNTPVDLISFVNHFKRRIFSGLGVSPIAMGEVETSNRNTAEVLDLSMQTITKRYQQIIKNSMEIEFVRELLLDGGFDSIRDSVDLNFPEIDLEAQIKKENNIIQKWQNNLIARSEARLELDLEKNVDESDTFLQTVTIPEINAKNGIQLEVAKIGARARGASVSGSSRTTANKNSTANAARPANQHGVSSGRPKIARDYVIELNDKITSKLNTLLSNDGYSSNLNISTLAEQLSIDVHDKLKEQLNYNLRRISEFHHLSLDEIDMTSANVFLSDVQNLIKDKILRVGRRITDDVRIGIFSDDFKRFLTLQKEKVLNLSKMLVYKSLGFKTILVESDDCSSHLRTNVAANDLSYGRIPPFRYNCKCKVDEESLYEFQK